MPISDDAAAMAAATLTAAYFGGQQAGSPTRKTVARTYAQFLGTVRHAQPDPDGNDLWKPTAKHR